MVPTDSHRKRLAEQGQFPATHSTRRLPVISVEQPRDKVVHSYVIVVNEVVVQDVVDEVVVDEVAHEMI